MYTLGVGVAGEGVHIWGMFRRGSSGRDHRGEKKAAPVSRYDDFIRLMR